MNGYVARYCTSICSRIARRDRDQVASGCKPVQCGWRLWTRPVPRQPIESTTTAFPSDTNVTADATIRAGITNSWTNWKPDLFNGTPKTLTCWKSAVERAWCCQGLRHSPAWPKGSNLSPGMLEKARKRGLDVVEGSATELPFEDRTFDVTCSFKVLAHILDIECALSEMARVTRSGGHVIAEFYNPFSIRGLVKRLAPPGTVSHEAHESHVYTRFDSPRRARELTPRGCDFVRSRGIRIVTPAAIAMRLPLVRRGFWLAESLLCDSPLRALAGFYVVAYRKL